MWRDLRRYAPARERELYAVSHRQGGTSRTKVGLHDTHRDQSRAKEQLCPQLRGTGLYKGQAEIQKSLRGEILALDILLTGLLGVLVDGITGAWYKLTPKDVSVTMNKKTADVIGPETITVTLSTKKGAPGILLVTSSQPGVHVHVASK